MRKVSNERHRNLSGAADLRPALLRGALAFAEVEGFLFSPTMTGSSSDTSTIGISVFAGSSAGTFSPGDCSSPWRLFFHSSASARVLVFSIPRRSPTSPSYHGLRAYVRVSFLNSRGLMRHGTLQTSEIRSGSWRKRSAKCSTYTPQSLKFFCAGLLKRPLANFETLRISAERRHLGIDILAHTSLSVEVHVALVLGLEAQVSGQRITNFGMPTIE